MSDLSETFTAHLESRILEETGDAFQVKAVESVSGGCIHQAWKLDGDRCCYFLKTNKEALLGALLAEATGLLALAEVAAVRVPRPVCWGSCEGKSFLLMEYMELGIGHAGTQRRLGRELAALHRNTGTSFGWKTDNFIGASIQSNNCHEDWATFWTECRLKPQIEWAVKRGLSPDRPQRLLDAVPRLLEGHEPAASLLHGDLWGGNIAALPDGTPVVFDPACYYGDRETDIAFTEMFGGFSGDFYAAYQEAWPLPPGIGERKALYNLYHELNHFNLFGGSYGRKAEATIAQLLR